MKFSVFGIEFESWFSVSDFLDRDMWGVSRHWQASGENVRTMQLLTMIQLGCATITRKSKMKNIIHPDESPEMSKFLSHSESLMDSLKRK